MTMQPLDPTQITLLISGSLALTQIVKDLGVEGNILKGVKGEHIGTIIEETEAPKKGKKQHAL